MPNETGPSRQYTDREVRLILKSAVEMQQQGADRAGELSGGMSLVELEQAAAEVKPDGSPASGSIDRAGMLETSMPCTGATTQLTRR